MLWIGNSGEKSLVYFYSNNIILIRIIHINLFLFLIRRQRAFSTLPAVQEWVEFVWNVMAHAQKPDLVFQGNGRVHLNRQGRQFSRVLAVEECGSAGSDCISWIDRVPRYSGRALPTHSIRLFPLHFPSRASPFAITFQTDSTGDFFKQREHWYFSVLTDWS
jgi:hypothetical protein